MFEKIKMISTLAKSEVATLESNEKVNELKSSLLPVVDQICQQTEPDSLIPDKGIFQCCLLVRIGQRIDLNLGYQLFLILMTRAQNYVTLQLSANEQNEEEVYNDISLITDKVLSAQLSFIQYILTKGILKQDLLTGSELHGVETLNILQEAKQNLSQSLTESGQSNQFSPQFFASKALWFDIITSVYSKIHLAGKQGKDPLASKPELLEEFQSLQEITFGIMQAFKDGSKHYITYTKDTQKPVTKRSSTLYTEILDAMVSFSVANLKAIPAGRSRDGCLRIYQQLVLLEDQEQACFTMIERLRILKELNFLFVNIPEIYQSKHYWDLIRQGLAKEEQMARKIAIAVLKTNLNQPVQGERFTQPKEFESLWTTFFDIMDTLESFGVHLIKGIWKRIDLYYNFIRNYSSLYDQNAAMDPLEDFRGWLLVIYARVGSHSNLNVKKHILKITLKREFITHHMIKFFLEDFLILINQGVIFKDIQYYTMFSKNSHGIYDFYNRYFQNESKDLAFDLRTLLQSTIKNASHPQTFLIAFKLLGTSYGQPGQIQFIGNEELKQLHGLFTNRMYIELAYFSLRYQYLKFLLKMQCQYLYPANVQQPDGQLLDWSTLFVVLGQFPIEFFSTRTIMIDNEGLQSAATLVDRLGVSNVQDAVQEYLTSLFTVKALPSQMPKFGIQSETVLTGISNIILILSNQNEQQVATWLKQLMEPCLDAFRQALSSTYLANKLVEAKINSFVMMVQRLYDYGPDMLRQVLRTDIFLPQLSQLLSRFNDNLIEPVSREQIAPSEQEKIEASFGHLDDYCTVLKLAIKMVHLHENRSDNTLEAMIKNLLQRAVKITSASSDANPWELYLQQFIVAEAISCVCNAYSTGISENIKQGISAFFAPDDIFSIGTVLLHNLIKFQPITQPNGPAEMTNSQKNFFLSQGTKREKLNQKVLLACWSTIADLVQIFQYDPNLKNELQQTTNPQIVAKAVEFLHSSTAEHNTSLFKVLRLAYVPSVAIALQSQDQNEQQRQDAIEKFQQVIRTCWNIVKELANGIKPEPLQEFVELAFAPELLQAYQENLRGEMYQTLVTFHHKIAKEMIVHSAQCWLILRGFFNHLMFTFATKPALMATFEEFVLSFGTTREMRSLDSQIKLYKLETLIAQVIPKKYETCNMEQITYEGAYIRTMTMIIIEGTIKSHLQLLLAGDQSAGVAVATDSLENLLKSLLVSNFTNKTMERADQPWSEGHRLRIRTWQFLNVCIQLLDPAIYTPAFRAQRVSQGAEDIVQFTMDQLWELIKLNHVPSVRQYVELFILKFICRFPDVALADPKFFSILLDPAQNKPAVASSMLMIAGFAMTRELDTSNAVSFKKKIFEHLIGYATANSAHSRCIAQYFLIRLQKDSQFGSAFMPSGVQPMIDHMSKSKDVEKINKRYQRELDELDVMLSQDGVELVLCHRLTEHGEFVGEPFVEMLRQITTETISEFRRQELRPLEKKDFWKLELKRRQEEGEFKLILNEESSQNYQKKILPWEQIEVDHEQGQKQQFAQRKRNEIIMCASLIDKVPNLAGLARTCEIMNASSLIIPNSDIVKLEEFKGVAVTAEKWIPMYQVLEKDLLDYLAFQKSNGYKILGLEQTANSKMLHEFDFPSRCILLLGKEKEGIPQEYYGMLDYCIEIPQFGIIRSLNVHVSGALCLWEYTKQQMAKSHSAIDK